MHEDKGINRIISKTMAVNIYQETCNHLFFSYIYSYVFKKIFGINLAPSINCCSLEPNPRDNSASCNSCGSWVVLSAPTTSDFSSRSFRASPLSLSRFHPRQDASAPFFPPCSFFISSPHARSLVASLFASTLCLSSESFVALTVLPPPLFLSLLSPLPFPCFLTCPFSLLFAHSVFFFFFLFLSFFLTLDYSFRALHYRGVSSFSSR